MKISKSIAVNSSRLDPIKLLVFEFLHFLTMANFLTQQDSVSIYVVCKSFIWPDFQNSEEIDKNR